MKQYLGIFASAFYAIVIRILCEFNVLEINSLSFLLITPAILGFIPFWFKQDKFFNSIGKAILFPLVAVLIFLLIAVVSRLEDIICLAILGFPYIVVSIVVSVSLYYFVKKQKKNISKDLLPMLILPVLLGVFEKHLPKKTAHLNITESVIIQSSAKDIYENLLSIPNLNESVNSGLSNYLGVPRPMYSTYDEALNIRRGYFENGVILFETVEVMIPNQQLVFKINVEKSNLKTSPTLQHALSSELVAFDCIKYELIELNARTTKLTLSTTLKINSNMTDYGKFWSELVIRDFEKNILRALQVKLQHQYL